MAVLAICVSAARAQQQQTVTLRIATLAPPGSDWEQVLATLASDIDKNTHHRVTLKLYPGVDERDFIRNIGRGQLDGAELTSYGLSLFDPTVRVLELPELFDSIEESDYAVDKMWPRLGARYKKMGIILGPPEEMGWARLYAQSEIDTRAALTKAKLWLDPDNAVFQALYGQLRINVIVLPPAQLDDAFAKQTVDSCSATPAVMQSLQSSKVQYRSSLSLGYRVTAVVIDSAVMRRISPSDQKVVWMLMTSAATAQRKAMRRANADALQAMQAGGLTESTASTELAAAFETAVQQTWQNFAGVLYSKQDLADVLKYRQEYRTAHKDQAGTPPP
jgi:TRAP-type C4-dicarboxylate transport system substrate-binding protein